MSPLTTLASMDLSCVQRYYNNTWYGLVMHWARLWSIPTCIEVALCCGGRAYRMTLQRTCGYHCKSILFNCFTLHWWTDRHTNTCTCMHTYTHTYESGPLINTHLHMPALTNQLAQSSQCHGYWKCNGIYHCTVSSCANTHLTSPAATNTLATANSPALDTSVWKV